MVQPAAARPPPAASAARPKRRCFAAAATWKAGQQIVLADAGRPAPRRARRPTSRGLKALVRPQPKPNRTPKAATLDRAARNAQPRSRAAAAHQRHTRAAGGTGVQPPSEPLTTPLGQQLEASRTRSPSRRDCPRISQSEFWFHGCLSKPAVLPVRLASEEAVLVWGRRLACSRRAQEDAAERKPPRATWSSICWRPR